MVLVEVDPDQAADPAAHLRAQLDFFRREVARKVHGLDDSALDTSQVPSGWTPRQLLTHLVFMERRWFEWGFLGRPVPDPWGDEVDGRWHSTTEVDDLVERLHAGGRLTTEVLSTHTLATPAATGGRFDAGSAPPTLLTIAMHVLQEYARHAGHLDIARELTDGLRGES